MYHNTTQEIGEPLTRFRGAANDQDSKVLNFFRSYPGSRFTPYEVWNRCFAPSTPITSVRRAITNLTNSGKLIKTSYKKDGGYGRPSYTWTLRGTITQGKFF